MTQYTLRRFEGDGVECPVCGQSFESKKGFGPHFYHKHPDSHPVVERLRRDFSGDPKAALRALYEGAGLTEREIAVRMGYPREGLRQAFESLGIDKEEWNIGKWVNQNPEAHQKVAQENAHKGTEAREENGMAGATGQDNPNWRGGKGVLDAVKKQLPTNWRQRKIDAKDRDGWECQNCGTTDEKMDSHHIVPVMSGGTHGYWNLMTLCDSCHRKAELFIRQYPEFDPVLVE